MGTARIEGRKGCVHTIYPLDAMIILELQQLLNPIMVMEFILRFCMQKLKVAQLTRRVHSALNSLLAVMSGQQSGQLSELPEIPRPSTIRGIFEDGLSLFPQPRSAADSRRMRVEFQMCTWDNVLPLLRAMGSMCDIAGPSNRLATFRSPCSIKQRLPGNTSASSVPRQPLRRTMGAQALDGNARRRFDGEVERHHKV